MVGLAPYTVWGMDAVQLQGRFWASRRVQVVRQGEATQIVDHAELFLLTDPRTLVLFTLAPILDRLSWLQPDLTFIRLIDTVEHGYREEVATSADGRFLRLRRVYNGGRRQAVRVAVTTDRRLAEEWQRAPDPRTGWRTLRRMVPRAGRYAARLEARIYDAAEPEEVARFMRDLVRTWRRPDATIHRIRRVGPGVWADETAAVPARARTSGPLWIGAGRSIPADEAAVGPAILWDDPAKRPRVDEIRWREIEALSPPAEPHPRYLGRVARSGKRLFDIGFSLAALAVTLPLYPFIALAIVIEDGFPVFFTHTRESVGGREFECIKFRSMRRDAESMKATLREKNQADGGHFYIEDDPRLTRVGRFLRKFQLDEIPQFINVLRGDMSVVGPRPSPFSENQYCPPWREARLSVRPGVTGLWQIRRTRAAGSDFQEWIKYDIEYVENQSAWLDLWIIWQTILHILRRLTRT